MRRDDYWNLFWLSGLPEAWMMSRPDRGDLNTADMTAKAIPHTEGGLPPEVRQLREKRAETGEGPVLPGE